MVWLSSQQSCRRLDYKIYHLCHAPWPAIAPFFFISEPNFVLVASSIKWYHVLSSPLKHLSKGIITKGTPLGISLSTLEAPHLHWHTFLTHVKQPKRLHGLKMIHRRQLSNMPPTHYFMFELPWVLSSQSLSSSPLNFCITSVDSARSCLTSFPMCWTHPLEKCSTQRDCVGHSVKNDLTVTYPIAAYISPSLNAWYTFE